MADETTRSTGDNDLSLGPGMAEGAADNQFGTGHTQDDRSEPVGAADRDADRVASGVDPEIVGDQGERSARSAMFGDNSLDDDAVTDDGQAVGLADRDADVERSG
jgi:hypothetical protein